jgi:hypothetical protein
MVCLRNIGINTLHKGDNDDDDDDDNNNNNNNNNNEVRPITTHACETWVLKETIKKQVNSI